MQKLNWLYPNFLTRIDHYLKINYPHIWRTRVHDFAWFSLILGNALAATFGLMIVGYDNVLSKGNVVTMHFSLAVLLGFVGLFWAMRLLRFKMKFSNFKTMLTTWVIYVLCIASLGLNLATFTSTLAYRTAYLYPDKTVQADYDYLNYEIRNSGKNIYYYDGGDYHLGGEYDEHTYNYSKPHVYWGSYLMEDYRTKDLLSLMRRHGYHYGEGDKIYRKHINDVRERLEVLKEAKIFVWQPILGKDFYNYEKRSFYHELLQMNWGMGMILLLFLPTLLFLLSAFGLRNVLISAFSTALIAGLSLIVVEMSIGLNYNTEENMLTVYSFIAFILMLTLILGRYRLQSWNYIAGVFMLMLSVVFFSCFIFIVQHYNVHHDNVMPNILTILPVSLLVSLMAASLIARQNDEPVMR